MKNHNSAALLQPDRPRPADRRHPPARFARAVPGLRLGRRSPRPGDDGMPTFVAYPHVIRDGAITPGPARQLPGQGPRPASSSTRIPTAPDFRLPELSLPANLSLDRLRQPPRDAAARSTPDRGCSTLGRGPRARRLLRAGLDDARLADASRRRSTCRTSRPSVRDATAARPTARAACWPGGWSRRA